jgi:hypothetical protein
MQSPIFWDMMPCSPLKIDGCFREVCRPHIQGQVAFTLVSYSPYSSTLKTKETSASETSGDFQLTTRCYIQGDIVLYNHHREILKFYLVNVLCMALSCRLFFFYPYCSYLAHRAFVKRFVSLQFLNLNRQSVELTGLGISPSQNRYLHKQRKPQTDNHTLSGIRTHDPSVRAGEDMSCLRPRGQCNRPWTD